MAEDASPGERASLSTIVASPGARLRISGLIQAWDSASTVGPTSLAWALRAASDADERRRHEQIIEIVWTGPSLEGTVLRRTDQVLLDLIRTARSTLHIVTFAAYRIPVLNEAMLEAARRGVEISLIFETPGRRSRRCTSGRSTGAPRIGRDATGLCMLSSPWPTRQRSSFPAQTSPSTHSTSTWSWDCWFGAETCRPT